MAKLNVPGDRQLHKGVRPRIGDLAVAMFDRPSDEVATKGKYQQTPCLVIGSRGSEIKFLYMLRTGEILTASLPKGRLRAVNPTRSKERRFNLMDINLNPDAKQGVPEWVTSGYTRVDR